MIARPWRPELLPPVLLAAALVPAFWCDKAIAQMVAQTDGTVLRAVLQHVTVLGKSDAYLVVSGLGGLALWWRARRRVSPQRRRRSRHGAAYCGFVFAAIAISGIAVNILKPLFGRARPRMLFREDVYGFDWFRLGSDFASFPSGHAVTAISIGLALSLIWPRYRAVLLGFFGVIALTRVGVNAHYLSDVIAGALLAYATTMALAAWLVKRGLPLSGYCGVRQAYPG